MIVFENDGEIDLRAATLIGVNVKEGASAIGFFGSGLKYGIACLSRWGESIIIQSGSAEFAFIAEPTEIRGKTFGILSMCSKVDRMPLGFTTDLGKRWEPWMVYRELWCNAHDEPSPRIYALEDRGATPAPKAGLTRVIVAGEKIEAAHAGRAAFILEDRTPMHVVDGLEIYDGPGECIFYRGIAVQKPDKPSLYTYNITEHLYLTEDRTAATYWTDPIIVRGLTHIQDESIIRRTPSTPRESMESRLDYDYAHNPGEAWSAIASAYVAAQPLDMPASVRSKFIRQEVTTCPTCGRPMEESS